MPAPKGSKNALQYKSNDHLHIRINRQIKVIAQTAADQQGKSLAQYIVGLIRQDNGIKEKP